MKYGSIRLGIAAMIAVALQSQGLAQHDHSSSRYESPGHIDSAAHRVEQAANAVAWELHKYHRDHHDFVTVYRETKEMWAVARHCHDLLHNNISNDRLKQNVRELDVLFHHLEGHMQDWDREYHARPAHGWHGYALDDRGHEYSEEHRLLRLMEDLERSLHHLMRDLDVKPSDFTRTSPVDAPVPPDLPPK